MKNSKLKKLKNNKSDSEKPKLTIQDKFSEIVKFKPSSFEVSNIKTNFNLLKNNKNCKVDITHNNFKNLNSTRMFEHYYLPYDSIFLKSIEPTNEPKPKPTNYKKYENTERYKEIIIDLDFSIFKLTSLYEFNDDKQYNSHNLSDIITLNNNDDELLPKLSPKIKNIELVIKTQIFYFLEQQAHESNLNWSSWIVNHIPISFSEYDRTLMIKYLYKKNLYKSPLNVAVNEMSFGKIKNIIRLIFKSKKIDPKAKIQLFDNILVETLNKQSKNISRDELFGYIVVLNRYRNSLMHCESFNTFLVKELVEQIKFRSNNSDLKFFLCKNTNTDKSIKYFIDNYWVFDKLKTESTKNNQSLINLNNKLHSEYFDNIKIGYYVEIYNTKTHRITCLDFDILSIVNLWFNN